MRDASRYESINHLIIPPPTMAKPQVCILCFQFQRDNDNHIAPNMRNPYLTILLQTLNPRSLQSRLTHILQHWPSDAVRPASVSVQTYLQNQLGQNQSTNTSKSPSTPAPKAIPKISESSVNALSALLENRFANKYPLSQKIRYPASDPEHYDNLIREFAEAPNRDWFGRLRKRLGGILRLQ